ncbi:YrdB family protein [Neobacillus sp. NPDC093127]|uniref:YrdB family protein n=1 Tax=Neobacillus sp. NPDC093127 TaxID=3364296 RepID=UPI00382F1FCB
MEGLKVINLGVRFLLEILVLVILGYWGFRVSQGTVMKIIVGIGSPLLVAVIWGMFGAPKASYPLSGFSFLLFEIVIFGLPAVALFFIEKQSLAYSYGVIVVINLVLMKIWHQ